jgi:flavin-dependent dehydrogenase
MRHADVLEKEPVCGWHDSRIRTQSPLYCRPIVYGNVVGVGEAAGCTSPNNGAGILPGIMSARLLADHILDNSSNIFVGEPDYWKRLYEIDLIKMFGFLDRETEILKKLLNHKRLGIRDYYSLYRNCRYFGMYPGMSEVVRIFKKVGARTI